LEVNGYVQQLNIRTTILMTLEGNVVQIPNATVYKSIIRNFTTNVNRRENFSVGIGYDDSIHHAQEIARNVLMEHPAVLRDPEPLVLAESLGSSTVNLQIYFWLNGHEHSWLKVRSSVIRLVKLAFQKHGISMPDNAREVVFPEGIPVTMVKQKSESYSQPISNQRQQSTTDPPSPLVDLEPVSTRAEAGLYSEASDIKEQARHVEPLKKEENLLLPPHPVLPDSSKPN
jgi:small-conductance mechanosensitive channel